MKEKTEEEKNYNRAKKWQLATFPLGGIAGNAFNFLMMSVSYYATGVVGLGTVIVSMIITGSRVFDGITDPLIGIFIDRTDGKFGKFRPFIVIGYTLMSATLLLLFFTAHQIPESIRLIYFIVLYLVYIIGYTFTTSSARAGQAVLTNDPSQRPFLGGIGMIYNILMYTLGGIYTAVYLVPKYGGYNSAALFSEFIITMVIFGGICTLLSVMGIWQKDCKENFGTGLEQKMNFKKAWKTLKGNRPLQMFVVAAATDKLAQKISSNTIVSVMLFGIIIGNYALSGILQGAVMIPSMIIVILGMRYASKVGTKKAYVAATRGAVITFILLFLLLWLGDTTQIQFDNWDFMSIAFIIIYTLASGFRFLSSACTEPMIPDIIDYETYRSDRFSPGIVGTLYSFIDKVVSSLSQTVVGLTLAFIGYKEVFPDVDTPYTSNIFWVTVFLFIGALVIGWLASLIAMKFYPLNKKRMAEIESELEKRRKKHMDDYNGDGATIQSVT